MFIHWQTQLNICLLQGEVVEPLVLNSVRKYIIGYASHNKYGTEVLTSDLSL